MPKTHFGFFWVNVLPICLDRNPLGQSQELYFVNYFERKLRLAQRKRLEVKTTIFGRLSALCNFPIHGVVMRTAPLTKDSVLRACASSTNAEAWSGEPGCKDFHLSVFFGEGGGSSRWSQRDANRVFCCSNPRNVSAVLLLPRVVLRYPKTHV